MEVYRERKKAILKALIAEYGKKDTYDMYSEFTSRKQKCVVCGADIREYSEWSDTGYEINECTNGCWKHETFGLISRLETNNFSFYGKLSESVMSGFEIQIKRNAEISKRNRRLFWRKKKSQLRNR